MEIFNNIAAAFSGTAFMSAFTYGLSNLLHKNFRQPVILDSILERLQLDLSQPIRRILGWLLHFLAGLVFVVLYQLLVWHNKPENITWLSGLVLGSISGIAGILVWMFVLTNLQHRLKVDKKAFYLHLFFAHIVFGLGVVGYYQFTA